MIFLYVGIYFFIGLCVSFLILRGTYKRGLTDDEKAMDISLAIMAVVLWPLGGLFTVVVSTLTYLGEALDKWFENRYGEKK